MTYTASLLATGCHDLTLSVKMFRVQKFSLRYLLLLLIRLRWMPAALQRSNFPALVFVMRLFNFKLRHRQPQVCKGLLEIANRFAVKSSTRLVIWSVDGSTLSSWRSRCSQSSAILCWSSSHRYRGSAYDPWSTGNTYRLERLVLHTIICLKVLVRCWSIYGCQQCTQEDLSRAFGIIS